VRHYYECNVPVSVGVEANYFGSLLYYSDNWRLSDGPPQLDVRFGTLEGRKRTRQMQCILFGDVNQKFDLVQTFEVLEHIPRMEHCEILNDLASLTGQWFVGTIARFGQKGYGHIANRDRADFIKELERRGFRNEERLSQTIARTLKLRHLRLNLVVARKQKGFSTLPDCEIEDPFMWNKFQNMESRQYLRGK